MITVNAFNAALAVIANATNLKLCICQTEPLALADVTSLSGSGGKRITGEQVITLGDIVVSDGSNALSRKLTIPDYRNDGFCLVSVDAGTADYWVAVYNDTELVHTTPNIANRELVAGAFIATPPIEYGFEQ